MGIIEKDGFKFHDGLSCNYIIIEDNRISEYTDYITNNHIKYVSINVGQYKNPEVNFLKKCSGIEAVMIYNPLLRDFTGLYYLKKLRILYSDEPNAELDLSLLENLEELSIGWSKFIKNIDKCSNLRILGLRGYKPKSKDLLEISGLGKIEELILTQSPIVSLRGCGDLPIINKLELNYINTLEYIDEIEKNSSTLKNLRFESCKKIKNHDFVSCLKRLEVLGFNSCSDIPSIGFIKELPNLRNFTFVNTNVVDGDLSPCIGLEYVGFFDKKHYTHKSVDFKK